MQHYLRIRSRIIIFVTHARFSSFFDLKRGPKATFFYGLDKKYYIQRAHEAGGTESSSPATLKFRKIAKIKLNPL